MAAKARRKKKTPVRAAKPTLATRKRRGGRPAKTVDPVQVLREQRERLDALFQEAHKVHETTLQGIRRLVETVSMHTRAASEQIAEEMEKLEAHCRTLQKRHAEAAAETDDSSGREIV